MLNKIHDGLISIHNTIVETLDTTTVTTLAISMSFQGGVELTMKLISLAIAIGYTSWRWFTEYKEKQNGKNK